MSGDEARAVTADWPPNLLNAVIDEALQREQRGDVLLKTALARLSPFELYDVVEGVAAVVREWDRVTDER